MAETVDIPATIVSVTSSGKYGVVRFKQPYDGLELAVINEETLGRIAVMNRLDGPLKRHADVRVLQLQRHSEAFVALHIA